MQITVHDRQTLLDIAVIALGSVAGVFALAERNGLSVTARLADGDILNYELEDVIDPAIRSAYAIQHICPATDLDTAEYRELLYATGTKRPHILRPPFPDFTDDTLCIDKVDEVLWQLNKGLPVQVENQQQFTRIFQDAFNEMFS